MKVILTHVLMKASSIAIIFWEVKRIEGTFVESDDDDDDQSPEPGVATERKKVSPWVASHVA